MLGLLPNQKKQLENYIEKAKTFQKSANVFFILSALVILGTLIFHTYPVLREAQGYRAEIQAKETFITAKTAEFTKVNAMFQEKAREYDVAIEQWKPILDQILPQTNPTDTVAKFLEDFAISSNKKIHPMKIENISFGEPRQIEDYFALKFNMSVEADEYNFIQFLQTIATSGSLREQDFYKGKPILAMSIESINVTLPEDQDIDPGLQRLGSLEGNTATTVPTLIFTVEMSAYFRPEGGAPKAAQPK